jgi:hypothetical protein
MVAVVSFERFITVEDFTSPTVISIVKMKNNILRNNFMLYLFWLISLSKSSGLNSCKLLGNLSNTLKATAWLNILDIVW